MRTVIGDILPFAVVVMVSPVNIVAAILLLFSSRPIINASWYLAGFLAGVAVVVTLLIVLADALGLSNDSDRSRAVSWILVALGAYLLFVAYRKFRSRPGPNDDPALPAWMDGIAGFGPARSLAIGAGIGAGNPKNIAVGLGTAVAVSSAGLSVADQVVAVAIYVVLASLGVATPTGRHAGARRTGTGGPRGLEGMVDPEQHGDDGGDLPLLRRLPDRQEPRRPLI